MKEASNLLMVRFFAGPASPLTRLAVASLLIGASAVFVRLVKGMAPTTGPVAVAFWRMLFGFLVMLPLALRGGIAGLKAEKVEWGLVVLAAFVFAGDLTFWHASIHRIGPGLATVLGNLQAVVLAVVGLVVFRELGAQRVILSLACALIALVLLTAESWSGGGAGYRTGFFLGLGSALCYSGYLLILRSFGQKRPARLSPVQRMLLMSLACAAFLALFAWAGGESLLLVSAESYALIFLYGALCQGLAWVWIAGAMPCLPASVSGLVLLLQPAVSFVSDVLFFGRGLTGLELAGLLLAATAIWLGSSATRVVRVHR